MMAKLSIPIQRSAIHRFKYLILLAALIFFAVGLAWFDGKREQSIFTSSYHGILRPNENNYVVKVNVTFDIDDKMTFIKVTRDKSKLAVSENTYRAESYVEFKTLSLQKQSFTKATISGRAQTTSGMKKFEETRFIPVAMHQSRGQFVLIMNNEDIFPIEAINEQINDKLVFILKRDR